MKVYIVRWFTAEAYESYSGVHKVFASHNDAHNFVMNHKDGPYEVDPDDFNEGYFISDRIEEYEVE